MTMLTATAWSVSRRMAKFLSFKVAPGVRLSGSSRGLRSHLGPRAARIHVGERSDRRLHRCPGPLTAYTSVGDSKPRSRTAKVSGLTAAQAERHRQVEVANAHFAQLEGLHRVEFPKVVAQSAAAVPLPPFPHVLLAAERQTLKVVSRFDRQARKAARVAARGTAEAWALDLMQSAEADRRRRQAELDLRWTTLSANDAEVTSQAIRTQFGGAARTRMLDVKDGFARLVTSVDGPDIVPSHKAAHTPGGAPTLHKVNQTERSDSHHQIVAAQVLVAAKQALAVAPGLIGVQVLAIDGAGAPVLGAVVRREAIESADWRQGAWQVLTTADETLRFAERGRTRELVTLDLRDDETFGPLIPV